LRGEVSSGVTNGAGARVRAWFEHGGWVAVWQVVYVASLAGATVAATLDGELSLEARLGIATLALLEAGRYVFVADRWRYWDVAPMALPFFVRHLRPWAPGAGTRQ
jgi:hypothetical protein